MGKLPAYKRIYYNDFAKEAQETIEQLSYTVNNAFEGIFNSLNKNINIRDNLAVSVRDVTVNVDANGVPLSTLTFGVDNNNPIDGILVIRALNQTNNNVFPTGGIFITYSQTGTKITINNITGLLPNNTFLVRVIAFLT